MSTSDSTPGQPYAGVSRSEATGWVAWITLAAVMLVLLVGRVCCAAATMLAGLAIFVSFAFIVVYPIRAVTAIGFAVMTIYAVAAHQREVEDAYSGP
jgi:hypothetical protein